MIDLETGLEMQASGFDGIFFALFKQKGYDTVSKTMDSGARLPGLNPDTGPY